MHPRLVFPAVAAFIDEVLHNTGVGPGAAFHVLGITVVADEVHRALEYTVIGHEEALHGADECLADIAIFVHVIHLIGQTINGSQLCKLAVVLVHAVVLVKKLDVIIDVLIIG